MKSPSPAKTDLDAVVDRSVMNIIAKTIVYFILKKLNFHTIKIIIQTYILFYIYCAEVDTVLSFNKKTTYLVDLRKSLKI